VVFILPAVGPGMAIIALWRLLQELANRLTRDGPNLLRQRVLLLVGQESPDATDPQMVEAMHAVSCW